VNHPAIVPELLTSAAVAGRSREIDYEKVAVGIAKVSAGCSDVRIGAYNSAVVADGVSRGNAGKEIPTVTGRGVPAVAKRRS
jgi:hypothetical protein